MKVRLALTVLAGLAASGAAAAEAAAAQGGICSRKAAGAAAIALRAARVELMAAPLGDPDTSIAPSTGARIETVKGRLRAYVRTMMDCAPTSTEPATLADAMEQRLGVSDEPAAGDSGDPAPDRHGKVLAFEVSRVKDHPDMLAVVATLSIKCGSDSMLMLYRRTRTGWEEVMVRRSDPYREVKGGWQDLRFAVSPADAEGRWFVATVSTTPWCTSAWQGMPYEFARPGPSADRPSVFFRGKGGIYLGNESDLSLRAERDSVEIRNDGGSVDPEILIRRHVRRYSVAGDNVRRVQPVAESVRDFVDEWIVSPWADSRAWSSPDPALPRLHAQLHPNPYETLGEFASIRACARGRTQVEIASARGPGWFFLVGGGQGGPWTLERVQRRPVAGCAGPDLLKRTSS